MFASDIHKNINVAKPKHSRKTVIRARGGYKTHESWVQNQHRMGGYGGGCKAMGGYWSHTQTHDRTIDTFTNHMHAVQLVKKESKTEKRLKQSLTLDTS